MWPFKSKEQRLEARAERQRQQQAEQIYRDEWYRWQQWGYPYDALQCGTCITEHAVKGCNDPEHISFTALAREKGIGGNPYLISRSSPDFPTTLRMGKFLLENKEEMVRLRMLYDNLYKRSAVPSVEEEEEIVL